MGLGGGEGPGYGAPQHQSPGGPNQPAGGGWPPQHPPSGGQPPLPRRGGPPPHGGPPRYPNAGGWPPPPAPPYGGAPTFPGHPVDPQRPPPTPYVPTAFPGSGGHPGYPNPTPPARGGGGVVAGVVIGLCVLALIACAGIGAAVIVSRDGGGSTDASSATARPSATTVSPTPSSTRPAVDLASRATDPVPMTVAELFPSPAIVFSGSSFPVLAKDAPTNCLGAASGEAAKALSAAGCTQVVRATVRDATSRYVATVGVANLATEQAADTISARAKDPDKNGFFDRLSGSGVARHFANPRETIVGTLTKGHWVIFVSAARADARPPSLDDPNLTRILSELRLYVAGVLDRRLGPD